MAVAIFSEYITQGVNYVIAHPSLFVAITLIYVFIFVLSILLSNGKPGLNPFRVNSISAAKPLVVDQTARDKILKQGFVEKRLPQTVDAIVIGSGIGGLTAASLLSRANKKVLVLEQHDQAGGCCHTYSEKGFEFDVGIHYIGEMRNRTMVRFLTDQLTEGQLRWADLDVHYDTVAIGEPGKAKEYPIMAGRDAWKASLLKQFPDQEKALDAYLGYLQEVRKSVLGIVALKMMPRWLLRLLLWSGMVHLYTNYFRYSKRTLQDVLDSITDDDQLKAVLSYNFGDYGTAPSQSSFSMHAILVNHYLYGGSYPVGGASELAFHIIPTIERTGGRVLVRATVTKILMDGSKAVGVRVVKSGNDYDLYAPLIISDAGVYNTFTHLLPREISQKTALGKLLEGPLRPGYGAVQLFVGLNGTKEELGLPARNIWAFVGNQLNQLLEGYLSQTAEQAETSDVPLLFISFPSAKDPSYNDRHPGKSVCTIVTIAQYSWFESWQAQQVRHRGDDYEHLKSGIGGRMWDQVLMLYPQLADKVEYFELGTPVSQQYYLGYSKGEIYGLDHNRARFGQPHVAAELRPDTEISGLLLTGQDVFSAGLVGAMMGGLLCASKALNRNLWQDLVQLKKSMAAKDAQLKKMD